MQPSVVAAGKQLLQQEGEKSFSLTKCSQSLLGGFAQVALILPRRNSITFIQLGEMATQVQLLADKHMT